MRMSIDEAIETLLDTRSYGTADIAKRVAIDTMRKYQKIERIISAPIRVEDSDIRYKAICEVVEDGNVD